MPRRAVSMFSTFVQSAGVMLLLLNLAFASTAFASDDEPTTGNCNLTASGCFAGTCSVPAHCTSLENCQC